MDGARLPRAQGRAGASCRERHGAAVVRAVPVLDPRLARGYNAANAALKVALGRIARAIFAASGR